jgi:hypothetical protein
MIFLKIPAIAEIEECKIKLENSVKAKLGRMR